MAQGRYANRSLLEQFKDVERQVRLLLAAQDVPQLPRDQQLEVAALRRLLLESKLSLRDYEYSETRREQLAHMAAARRELASLQKQLLAMGTLIGPADIADLSAHIDMVVKGLA